MQISDSLVAYCNSLHGSTKREGRTKLDKIASLTFLSQLARFLLRDHFLIPMTLNGKSWIAGYLCTGVCYKKQFKP